MTAPETPWMRRVPHRAETSAPPAPPPPAPPVRRTPAPAPPLPAPAPAPVPVAAPAPSAGDDGGGGLTRLSAAPAGAPPAAPERRGRALLLEPPPGVAGAVTLDPEDPVARLDALQSGIGALLIRGADRVAWEDQQEHGGVVEPGGPATGDDVPRFGNRSLIRPFDGGVLVTLRHVRRLRRLLVDAPAATPVTLTPFCAGTVRAADLTSRLRLSVVEVGGRLEVRVEYGLPEDWRGALAAMGWSPLALIPRSEDVWS